MPNLFADVFNLDVSCHYPEPCKNENNRGCRNTPGLERLHKFLNCVFSKIYQITINLNRIFFLYNLKIGKMIH